MTKTLCALMIIFSGSLATRAAEAHCQVPCGIYDDAARVQQIREHLKTIDKAVHEMARLSSKRDAQSKNQLVRWIMTKEQHAEKIIRTISDYFLAQKVKPAAKGKERARYLQQLARHHAVMVAAMKCKQQASPATVKALGRTIDGIAGFWKK
jgi:nickel superoxide dismutase